MKNNLLAFVEYFRTLAVSHHLLKHDPTSETEDSAISKKHFTRVSMEEVVTGLRSKVGFPALLLEKYENDISQETVYDLRQNPKAAFMILDTANLNSSNDQEEAQARCEEIAYDMLQKIWQDHYGKGVNRCETPFKDILQTVNMTFVGPLFDSQFGIRVEFDFSFSNVIKISQAPAEGTFI
jgi:hypothetical protein